MNLKNKIKNLVLHADARSSLILILSVFFILLTIVYPNSTRVIRESFYKDIRNILLIYIFFGSLYLAFIKKKNLCEYLDATNVKLAMAFISFALFLRIMLLLIPDTSVGSIFDTKMGMASIDSYTTLSKILLYGGVIMFFLTPINYCSKYFSKNLVLLVGLVFSIAILIDSVINIPLLTGNLITRDEVRGQFGLTLTYSTTAAYRYSMIYMFLWGYYLSIERNKLSTLLISMISCACISSIFITSTRIAILFIPIGTLILIFLARNTVSIDKKKILLLILLITIPIALITYPKIIKPRVEAAVSEYQTGSKKGSIALRLTAWDASLKTIKEKPWQGDRVLRNQIIFDEINKGNYDPYLVEMGHAHNDYLEAASLMGLPMLIAILIFYGGLLVITYKLGYLALSGVVISMGFLGLTDCLLLDLTSPSLMCLFFMVAMTIFSREKINEN